VQIVLVISTRGAGADLVIHWEDVTTYGDSLFDGRSTQKPVTSAT